MGKQTNLASEALLAAPIPAPTSPRPNTERQLTAYLSLHNRILDEPAHPPCAHRIIHLCLELNFSFLKDELFTLDSLPNVKYIINDRLEMRCRIVGFGDKHIVVLPVGCWGVERGDGDEPEGQP